MIRLNSRAGAAAHISKRIEPHCSSHWYAIIMQGLIWKTVELAVSSLIVQKFAFIGCNKLNNGLTTREPTSCRLATTLYLTSDPALGLLGLSTPFSSPFAADFEFSPHKESFWVYLKNISSKRQVYQVDIGQLVDSTSCLSASHPPRKSHFICYGQGRTSSATHLYPQRPKDLRVGSNT